MNSGNGKFEVISMSDIAKKIINEHIALIGFLVSRAKVKAEASFYEREGDLDVVLNSHAYDAKVMDNGDIYVDFRRHEPNCGTIDCSIHLESSELEMGEEEFTQHLAKEFAHIAEKKEQKKRFLEEAQTARELRDLVRLEAKYRANKPTL